MSKPRMVEFLGGDSDSGEEEYMHLSNEEAELVPRNECQLTKISEPIPEDESIPAVECQMTPRLSQYSPNSGRF